MFQIFHQNGMKFFKSSNFSHTKYVIAVFNWTSQSKPRNIFYSVKSIRVRNELLTFIITDTLLLILLWRNKSHYKIKLFHKSCVQTLNRALTELNNYKSISNLKTSVLHLIKIKVELKLFFF